MAKIVYSVAGEGRGHATRVRALVEELRHQHRLVLLAAGDAHSLLAQTYRDSDVRVHRIPGLRFRYSDHGISYLRTSLGALRYLAGLPRLVTFLEKVLRRAGPDLVLTDFEPALPRAALRCGIPFLSFDHQHYLTVCDLSSLPWWLRWRARGLGFIVDRFYRGQVATVVSSFFRAPLKPSATGAVQVGVLLRPEILAARPESGEHLLTYLRRDVPAHVLQTLQAAGRPVKVYGLGEHSPDGRLEFCPISEDGFLRDLADCRAVISTAGNQLVGEALYLGKPVLALPEQRNYEQYINAHFLARSGAGTWSEMESFDARVLAGFLERERQYRVAIRRDEVNGNPGAVAAITRHLPARPVVRP